MSALMIAVVVISILLVVVGLLAAYMWFRKRSRARAAAREKLLQDQTESYDTTMPSNKEYRNVYKKAVLKAGSTESPKPSMGKSKQRQQDSSVASIASADLEVGESVKREGPVTDDQIFDVVISSWYEHLIRHAQTEYLRTIVKNSSGMSMRDLIPEMRMLIDALPNVPLNRWSGLSASDKAAISTAAVSLKTRITQSVGKRFTLAV